MPLVGDLGPRRMEITKHDCDTWYLLEGICVEALIVGILLILKMYQNMAS